MSVDSNVRVLPIRRDQISIGFIAAGLRQAEKNRVPSLILLYSPSLPLSPTASVTDEVMRLVCKTSTSLSSRLPV